MEECGQLHVPVALSRGKELWYPLTRRLGGSLSRSGCFEEHEKLLPPARNRTRTIWTLNLAAILALKIGNWITIINYDLEKMRIKTSPEHLAFEVNENYIRARSQPWSRVKTWGAFPTQRDYLYLRTLYRCLVKAEVLSKNKVRKLLHKWRSLNRLRVCNP